MKEKPYLITSDQHAHDWNQFSKTLKDGSNSRLSIILAELVRATKFAKSRGAEKHYMAGDLFHVRGSVKPSVFNPTHKTIKTISGLLDTVAIPGNHDLEGSKASELGNAMQSLSEISGFQAATSVSFDENVIVFPWCQDLDELRSLLKENASSELDAIIHAPINGVITGMPESGLTPEELAEFGYKRVFAGHLHDHREFCDGKVYSIGATTHQTWNDVDSKAGFLLVYPDRVEFHESKAPKFIDLTADTLEKCMEDEEQKARIKGNCVRVKIPGLSETEIKEARNFLVVEARASGAVFVCANKTPVVRKTKIKEGESLEKSITTHIEEAEYPKAIDKDALKKLSLEILSEADSE